jgi:hypothetical protein
VQGFPLTFSSRALKFSSFSWSSFVLSFAAMTCMLAASPSSCLWNYINKMRQKKCHLFKHVLQFVIVLLWFLDNLCDK